MEPIVVFQPPLPIPKRRVRSHTASSVINPSARRSFFRKASPVPGPSSAAMSAHRPPRQHAKWTKGDFELVSNDGVKFRTHTYHLQSASGVFCDMIETGSGEKRIELDETAATIEQFLDLVTTGSTSFVVKTPPDSAQIDYAQAVNLVAFLRKFECQAAIGYLNQFVKTPSKCAQVNHLRLLTALHLGVPETCAEMLGNEPELFTWLHPAVRKDTLPQLLPFEVFQYVPQRYLWALMAAGVHDQMHVPVVIQGVRNRKSPSERFLHFMEEN